MKKSLVTLVFGVLVAMMSLSSCTRVDSGSEALRVDQFGNDKGVPIATEVKGWVFYNPFTQDVFEYPNTMQHCEYELVTFTAKGGSIFKAKPTFNCRMKPGRVTNVFLKYRKDMDYIQENFMLSAVNQVYLRVGNSFTPDSLMSSLAKFESMLESELAKEIGDDFEVERLVSNLVPPDGLEQSINDKNQMVQDAMKKEFEVRKAIAEANVKMANARGDSAQKVIAAQADARAYELQTRSLNDKIISKMYIEKWDGKLPVYGAVPNLFKNVQ